MQPKKQENRGGHRDGSGRKKIVVSYDDKIKKKLLKTIDRHEKANGKNIYDVALEAYFSEDVDQRCKNTILKLITDVFTEKTTHQTKDVNVTEKKAPEIYLPVQSEIPEEFKKAIH